MNPFKRVYIRLPMISTIAVSRWNDVGPLTRMCLLRLDDWLKLLPHTAHL